MSKIHEKIMKTNFAKQLKRLIITAVCVMLIGGGISAVMLRQQIGEVVSNINQWEQLKESGTQNNVNEEQNTENKTQDNVNEEQSTDNENQQQSGENEDQNDEGKKQDNENEKQSRKDKRRYGEYDDENRNWDGESGYHYERKGYYRGEHDFFENMIVTTPTTEAFIAVGITIFSGFVFLLLFWILIAAWLYQAAVRSGMNGLLWLAAGLIGNVCAAVAFLLIRSFIRIKCPSCGAALPKKNEHCPRCGKAIREKCENCGEICAAGDQFCRACGKKLHEDSENNENNQ